MNDFVKLSKMLDDYYKIVLVGLSEKQIKEVPDNIIKISRTNSAVELAAIYTAADVFLNLTYEDNYPTVNIEAIACGTQVLTYNTGGSPEIVEKFNGYVVKCGKIEEVAEKIQTLKEFKAEEFCLEIPQFDSSRATRDYLRLYNGN